MSEPVLLIEKRGPVDWVTLNRPNAQNSLDPELIDALNHYFEGLERDYDTRVVVIRAVGKNFCAGLDIKASAKRNTAGGYGADTQASLDGQRRSCDLQFLHFLLLGVVLVSCASMKKRPPRGERSFIRRPASRQVFFFR